MNSQESLLYVLSPMSAPSVMYPYSLAGIGDDEEYYFSEEDSDYDTDSETDEEFEPEPPVRAPFIPRSVDFETPAPTLDWEDADRFDPRPHTLDIRVRRRELRPVQQVGTPKRTALCHSVLIRDAGRKPCKTACHRVTRRAHSFRELAACIDSGCGTKRMRCGLWFGDCGLRHPGETLDEYMVRRAPTKVTPRELRVRLEHGPSHLETRRILEGAQACGCETVVFTVKPTITFDPKYYY